MIPPKLTYKRGDVLLVLYPNSDLRTFKLRPALVIQADNLQTGIGQVVVAMITSNTKRANHPSRILVIKASPEGQQSRLAKDSVVMTDNLMTIADTEIDKILGSLPMNDVNKALRYTLSL